MNLVTGKFGGSKRVNGHKISFSLGAWFSCVEQKNRQEGLFWVVLGERPAVVGENCLQEGEGPINRKRVLDGLA